MSSQYIEENVSASARDIHRALSSLQEELEAVDYYNQRSEQTEDPELRDLLEHNREEETEHAAMLFEWLRRHAPDFDEKLKAYLFTKGKFSEIEDAAQGSEATSDRGDLGLGALK